MGQTILNEYNSIKLNGVCRKGSELRDFCRKEIERKDASEWLVDIYQFVLQWLSTDEMIVAHSSGSTGDPKHIMLQKKHMVASAQKTIRYFNLQPEQTALLCLSANYIAGKMMIVRAFVGQFNLVLVKPDGQPLKNMSWDIDFTAMVPLQVSNCIKYFSKRNLVKTVIIGGGSVSEKLKKELKILPVQFFETYGMTETVSHVAIRKIGSDIYFKPMPSVILSVDERQCLVIEASDIADERIVTNDVVELESTGQFLFLGRYDNVINSGGVKVSPELVEEKLSAYIKIPFVISSLHDDKLGEKVVLVIERDDVIENIECLLSNDTGLTKYERPKQVIQIDKIPVTDTQKVKRNELKMYIAGSHI